MSHQIQDFTHLVGTLHGLSAKQMEAHLGLYAGYVKKLNEIEAKLLSTDKSGSNYSFNEWSELKRRYAVAFNGTYLHQMYFQNLSADPTAKSSELEDALKSGFGSAEEWEKDARSAAAATPGWVVTAVNKVTGQLQNHILYEHHIGPPIHQEIILALDCWEHAFMIDYGTNKAEYLKTFISNIDWERVGKRLTVALVDKNTHMES